MAVRNEANFLAEYANLPDDLDVYSGLTLGEAKAFLKRRPDDPAGSVLIPSLTYSSEAADVGQMAVYARQDLSEAAPIVLFVHGGGWAAGHHYSAFRFMHPLATTGYVTATATYRLAGEGAWPAALHDVKCAVRWLRAHANYLGGDPEHIVICGDSAGGQLAALTALTPGFDEGSGGCEDVSSAVQAAVLFYPAVDIEAMASEDGDDLVTAYFGAAMTAASPINRVTSLSPPVLTLTGDADTITPVAHIRRFHMMLEAAGVRQRLEVFPQRRHGFDVVPADFEPCLRRIEDFLLDTVGAPTVGSATTVAAAGES